MKIRKCSICGIEHSDTTSDRRGKYWYSLCKKCNARNVYAHKLSKISDSELFRFLGKYENILRAVKKEMDNRKI